jgi:predicted transcriptional regulator
MSTLTIRIEDDLKRKASKQAYQLGIPLTLVIKNALQNFIKNPSIVIGTPEIVDVTPQLQRKMDKIASILS